MGKVRQRKEKSQKRCINEWVSTVSTFRESSGKSRGVCLRITLPVGIFHLVEAEVAPRSMNSYASRVFLQVSLKALRQRRGKTHVLEVGGYQLSIATAGELRWLRPMGRQSAASANKGVMDALRIWFCNKVGKICQTIKINLGIADNKNLNHQGKYLQHASYHTTLARLLHILPYTSSNSPRDKHQYRHFPSKETEAPSS